MPVLILATNKVPFHDAPMMHMFSSRCHELEMHIIKLVKTNFDAILCKNFEDFYVLHILRVFLP